MYRGVTDVHRSAKLPKGASTLSVSGEHASHTQNCARTALPPSSMFSAGGVAKAHAVCSFGGFRQGIKNVGTSTIAWLLPPTPLTRLRNIVLLVLTLEIDKMSISTYPINTAVHPGINPRGAAPQTIDQRSARWHHANLRVIYCEDTSPIATMIQLGSRRTVSQLSNLTPPESHTFFPIGVAKGRHPMFRR